MIGIDKLQVGDTIKCRDNYDMEGVLKDLIDAGFRTAIIDFDEHLVEIIGVIREV